MSIEVKSFRKIAVTNILTAVFVFFGCGDGDNSTNNGGDVTYRLMITTSPIEGGSVVRDPHQTSYIDGMPITLTATANAGFEFAGWTGDLTSANSVFTFNISRNTTLVANFRVRGDNPIDGGESGTFTDSRDGQTYRYVTIGTQTWMAENLNYETSSGSWCYNNQTSNCNIYGRLYDWTTAMNIRSSYSNTLWDGSDVNHRGVCPSGWHLPRDAEWDELMIAVGGVFEDMGYWGYWSGAGMKLKSPDYWVLMSGVPVGTDDFGFSALPGGGRWGGSFDYVGGWGYWWSATENVAGNARSRGMRYNSEGVGSGCSRKSIGLSVRCVRD